MKRLITFIILSCFFYSCTKRTHLYSSETDSYNQRKQLSEVKFKRKISPIGIGFVLGCGAAGAYAGDKFNIVEYNSSSEAKITNKNTNYIVGSAIGLGVGTILNYIIAKRDKIEYLKSEKDRLQWIKSYDDNFINLSTEKEDFSFLRIMHKQAEHKYSTKTFQDVLDFFKAFPASENGDKIVINALDFTDRQQTLSLLSMHPSTIYHNEVKAKYLTLSQNFTEFENARNQFPNVPDYDYENLGSNLVTNLDEFKRYNEKYKEKNKLWIRALRNSFKTEYSTSDEKEIFDVIGSKFNIKEEHFSDASDKIKRNYTLFLLNTQLNKKLQNINEVFNKLSWMQFDNADQLIFNYLFNLLDQQNTNGNKVISTLTETLADLQYVKMLKVGRDRFQELLTNKYSEIAEKYLILTESSVVNSMENSDWDEWQRSIGNAFFVRQNGDLQLLVKGKVFNTSKYDLPVKLNVGASVFLETEGKFLSISLGKPRVYLPNQISQFYIQKLKAGQSDNFASIINYGNRIQKAGTDLILLKVHSQLKVEQALVGFSSFKGTISDEIKRKQADALKLNSTQVDAPKIYEFWSEYNPESYRYTPGKRINGEGTYRVKSQSESTDLRIEVEEPAKYNPNSTSIGIRSNGDAERKKYSVVATDKNGDVLFKTDDPYDDNFNYVSGAYHFPVNVSIYYLNNGKAVSASIDLLTPGHFYRINIEKD